MGMSDVKKCSGDDCPMLGECRAFYLRYLCRYPNAPEGCLPHVAPDKRRDPPPQEYQFTSRLPSRLPSAPPRSENFTTCRWCGCTFDAAERGLVHRHEAFCSSGCLSRARRDPVLGARFEY